MSDLIDINGITRRAVGGLGLDINSLDATADFSSDQQIPRAPNETKPEHRARLTVKTDSAGNPLPNAVDTIIQGLDTTPGIANTEAHLLSPLRSHGGILFPYTPVMTMSQNVEYIQYKPVHSIQDFYGYARTPSVTFNVSAPFTVQNIDEGRYALACIHFLRVITKMYFGISSGNNAGSPPPVLTFNAYGNYMFNNLPVVLTEFSFDFTQDVDYVEVPVSDTNGKSIRSVDPNSAAVCNNNAMSLQDLSATELKTMGGTQYGVAWLPTKFDLRMALAVTRSPAEARNFNLEKFRSGSYLTDQGIGDRINTGGGWW